MPTRRSDKRFWCWTNRQLLEHLVHTLERFELSMSAETDYIEAALSSLDTQLSDLSTRLAAQADVLKNAVQNAADLQSLKEDVNSAADRIQADAVAVSQFAQPSVVADPNQPGDANPVPTDPNTPIPTDDGSSPTS